MIHLSLIDYITVSGSMERNVLEFVDHLHEHFINPCSINENGRYNVPNSPTEGYRYVVFLNLFNVMNPTIVEDQNTSLGWIRVHDLK